MLAGVLRRTAKTQTFYTNVHSMHDHCSLLQIVPISIPDLDAARVSHMYTFGSEAASCHMQALQSAQLRHQLAADVRITLGIAKSFKAQQFVQAQRIRARMVTYMEQAFDAVDFIATPTIPDVAPAIQ